MQIAADWSSAAAMPRRPLHEEVAERLRELITEGLLAPGARLNERVLCDQLRVSRTPLREAFKLLAGERLIELHANRGARVASLSRADIEHLFELMAALEGLSGALAAARRTPAELAEVRALHYEMLAAHVRRDLPAYYRLNRAIHEAINRCTRNPVLAETYHAVNSRIQNLRFRSNFDHDKWDEAVREHQAMVDALAEGDGARLRAVLERHLASKRDAVLRQFDAQAASAGDPLSTGPVGAVRGGPGHAGELGFVPALAVAEAPTSGAAAGGAR
jgi:DNA-binding GntR family transcriptional regulator